MTDPSKDDAVAQPWEDTLIIAFRDIQWMLHSERHLSRISKAVNHYFDICDLSKVLTEPSDQYESFEDAKREIYSALNNHPSTPPLLAKLDDAAESTAGDVITAHDSRFFLIEFKSEVGDKYTEHGKFVGIFTRLLDEVNDEKLVELSNKGHFFISQRPEPATKSTPTVRAITLEARTYYEVVRRRDARKLKAVTMRPLLESKSYGLRLAEMADYLRLLCEVHSGDKQSGGHPLKVAVACSDGEFWPIADLSELHALGRFFETGKDKNYQSHRTFSDTNIQRLKDRYLKHLQLPEVERAAEIKKHLNKNRSSGNSLK